MKKANLRIGDLELRSPFLLAPMAGITDRSMRSLCYQAGASLTYTEMVSAKGLWYGDRKSADLLTIGEDEGPVGYQLFGSEPVVLAHAVTELSELSGSGIFEGEDWQDGYDGIPGPPPKPWPGYSNELRPVLFDLNAGCPVPKIVKNGEGSALLKDPDLLYDCVHAMCRAADEAGEKTGAYRPVTVKIRKGFSRDEDLAVENAKAIEAAGAAAVTVHGRSREQYYEGKADWDCIAQVKKAVDIPVIGNGDVMCGDDAIRMMDETGCDAVMIARGALGNPWIFGEAGTPTLEERIATIKRHIDMVCEDKGEYTGVREMRKHIGWYVKGMHGAATLRREVNGIDSAEEMKRAVSSLLR